MSSTHDSTRRVSVLVRRRLEATRHFLPVLIVVIVLGVTLSVWQSAFLTVANIRNLLTGVSVLWVVSLGQTLVVLSGGIDLSVGAIAALTGILLGKTLGHGVPSPILLVLAVLFGAAVGGIANGVPIGRFRLSFFVVTLASLTALTGAVNLWSNTKTYFVTDKLVGKIGFGALLGVPTAIWVMAVTFAIALFVQSRTYFGRDVYAVGGSIAAARLSGIRTERTLVIVYAVSGLCAAIGGVIAIGRIGAASPQVDGNLPLQAAAAVLLGGTLLTGGAGGVGGTAIGVIFIGMLQNGLSIAGIPSFWQQVVTGLILVIAVAGGKSGTAARFAAWRERSRRSAADDSASSAAPLGADG